MKVKVVKNCDGDQGAYCMRRYCGTPGCREFRRDQRAKESLERLEYFRQLKEGPMFREGLEFGEIRTPS